MKELDKFKPQYIFHKNEFMPRARDYVTRLIRKTPQQIELRKPQPTWSEATAPDQFKSDPVEDFDRGQEITITLKYTQTRGGRSYWRKV